MEQHPIRERFEALHRLRAECHMAETALIQAKQARQALLNRHADVTAVLEEGRLRICRVRGDEITTCVVGPSRQTKYAQWTVMEDCQFAPVLAQWVLNNDAQQAAAHERLRQAKLKLAWANDWGLTPDDFRFASRAFAMLDQAETYGFTAAQMQENILLTFVGEVPGRFNDVLEELNQDELDLPALEEALFFALVQNSV